MAGEHLWDSAKEIVVKMRDIIQSNTEDRVKESRFGWQYRLLSESKDMKGDMEAQGYQVYDCTVFHFVVPARIENPTRRLLLVPIQGTSSLTPAEILSPGSYWDIKDDANRVLTPDQTSGAAIMIITLQEDK